MAAPLLHPALKQFIDDEMLRIPLLFDQLGDATQDALGKTQALVGPLERAACGDLLTALKARRSLLLDRFVQSVHEQAAEATGAATSASTSTPVPAAPTAGGRSFATLALVDETAVAVDVEIARCIEAICSVAEYELRELQTFTAALVGDMDVARDHNPFGPETHARALWAAALALPLTRGHQVMFMRHASMPLAQLLRRSFAASCSRLESAGIEPASHRTLILPSGSRRYRAAEDTFSPDFDRLRETMPATLDSAPPTAMRYDGQPGASDVQQRDRQRRDIVGSARNAVDRQAVELVSRLFDAILSDSRVPPDLQVLLSRLHGPALRLTLVDPGMLDKDKHPLWRFVDRLAHEAQMTPDPADPERAGLLKVGLATIEQLASEPAPTAALYFWAIERLDGLLKQRLARRCAQQASHIGALQKLEDTLSCGQAQPSTLQGMLDVPQLDTVPAELMAEPADAGRSRDDRSDADAWLDRLRPGDWVRMFLQGHWVQAQLLWPGAQREIWLFGDGASDTAWAIRRRALTTLFDEALLKTLITRSVLKTAARKVQQQMVGGDGSPLN